MRLCYALLVASIAFDAGNCVVLAVTAPTIPQLDIADRAQPINALQTESQSKRFLRTTDTGAMEDEERGNGWLDKASALFHPKYVHKDGTFTKAYVLKLVNEREYRIKTFADWAKWDTDGEGLKNALKNLDKEGHELLVKQYEDFLKGRPT